MKKKLAAMNRQPYFNDNLKHFYRLLTLYFSQNSDFENYSFTAKDYEIPYSLNKGLLVQGDYGVGKSFALEKIFKPFAQYTLQEGYRLLRCQDLITDFQLKGMEAIQKYEKLAFRNERHQHLYMDEIGAQPHEVKHYGTVYKPVEQFLFHRYNLFIDYHVKTHASTNLSINEFLELYDHRIYSRLFEMFNIIVLDTGLDLRLNFKKL